MSQDRFDGLSRRAFLKIAGAASVLAGCSSSEGPQKLIPLLNPPEHAMPGSPLFYRTVCRECDAGCGVTARVLEGRVVKLEGNPDDPIGRGALCARGQAALQRLYAPDRVRGPMRRGPDGTFVPVSWDEAMAAIGGALAPARARGARGVRILSRPEPGSAVAVQRAFLAGLGAPAGQRVVFDPAAPIALRSAGDLLFGHDELPVFDLAAAKSVVAFGADFVETWVSPVELARGFAEGRGKIGAERTRLTWIGPRLALTGANADTWLRARAGTEPLVALGLLRWICDPAHAVADLSPDASSVFDHVRSIDLAEVARQSGVPEAALAKLGAELAGRRPSAVLGPGAMCGGTAGIQLAAAIQLVNHLLGNIGRTVLYGLDSSIDPTSPPAALHAFVEDMSAGRVEVLFVHHADPAGALPASLDVAGAIGRVPFVVSFSDRLDDTTRLAHWILPDHHTLESFGDVSPRRGITSLAQPAMLPVWDTRSAPQTLMDIAAGLPQPASPVPSGDYGDFVVSRIDALLSVPAGGDPADARRGAFSRGGVYAGAKPVPVSLRPLARDLLVWVPPAPSTAQTPASTPAPAVAPAPATAPAPGDAATFDLVLFPTALRGPGRSTDLPWLHEVPDAMTTVSWSSWVEIAPATARRLGVVDGDVIAVMTSSGKAELPVYVFPGIREDAVGIPMGGPEPLSLLTDDGPGSIPVHVQTTGRKVTLPRLEGSSDQGGREIVRTVTAEAPILERPPRTKGMYPGPDHPKHRWAMAVDMDRCTGCQACIVACYAENNIPVNGGTLDARGRNMEWLRLERYFREEAGALQVDLLLMLCQHCTFAPCEPVCPVYATYHTSEGLNAQVYNRCVGTRYCSNNCPYKVRTFNWRDPVFAEPMDHQLNPDVTVRSKGVMEKCTFCVQRIRAAEITAEQEARAVRDGDVITACAQTCPTRAIVFGDARDPESAVSRLAREGRAYRVLEDLNTQPAVTYLARVREI